MEETLHSYAWAVIVQNHSSWSLMCHCPVATNALLSGVSYCFVVDIHLGNAFSHTLSRYDIEPLLNPCWCTSTMAPFFVGTMRAGTAIKSWGRLNDFTPGCGIHQRPPQHMGPMWYLCQNFRRWREFIYLFPTKQSNFVSYKYRLNLHVHCWQITKLIGENIVQFQPYIHCNIFIRFRHK